MFLQFALKSTKKVLQGQVYQASGLTESWRLILFVSMQIYAHVKISVYTIFIWTVTMSRIYVWTVIDH